MKTIFYFVKYLHQEMTRAIDFQISIFAISELYYIVSEVRIYGLIIYLNRWGGEKNSNLEYLQNQNMAERYFLFWNWRFVFHVNLISFPIAMGRIAIQCQENLQPKSIRETLSLFFIFTDQSGTGEKIPRKKL